jgi:AraC family transcriptional regulator
LAKIAPGEPGRIETRLLAIGDGWTVKDVVCSCGPGDLPYDEQHDEVAIAVVTSGTFQYRGSGSNGREMMTPGSLLLGSPGQCFECGHEHGVGDRCLSFRFTPE